MTSINDRGCKSLKRLTDRDVEILSFVNSFGYCDVFQLMKRFEVKKTWMYKSIGKLIEMGLVKHSFILNSRHRIYLLTNKGAKYTDLPAVDHVTVGQYRHHGVLIDVYLKLRKQYLDSEWVSERSLLQEKFSNGLGKKGHVSDGILILPDKRKIAIEVEISNKAKYRIEKILRSYGVRLDIKEVWYFCSKQVMTSLAQAAGKMPFIKIYNFEEFLYAE